MNKDSHSFGPWISGMRSLRALKFIAADGFAFGVSLCVSIAIRYDFDIPRALQLALPELVFWVVVAKLVVFYCFRQFHILPDFFGIKDLQRLVLANLYVSVIVALVDWGSFLVLSPPRSIFAVDFLISLMFLAGLRLALRMRRERLRILSKVGPGKAGTESRRIGIVGAGEAGAVLARELRVRPDLGLIPVVFFDDDARKWEAHVHDIPVAGRPEVLLTEAKDRLSLEEVVISMPSAPAKRIREVIEVLQAAKLKFRTVPSLTELALGKVQVSQLRSVQIEDLLGRPPIELETEHIRELLQGRVVLVTGAGGSIGSELCRQIAKFEPASLLLVERSEVSMFPIEQELIAGNLATKLVPLVADILDSDRIRGILREHRPEIIFHAAAHKHVPLMEGQPAEAIRNNSLGTARLAELAAEAGVGRFVLISTDKAINPTSVMGASKRLAEIFLQAFHAANPKGTRFMAVRFGNVLGSSGSVIPIFKKQIEAGGPVKVTHPEMTRYFMTIPEAVGLVLQSAVQGRGGEVFVLDMGKPVKIVDLARQLIELSGFRPDKDIAIEFVGLRPGEKLFEELNSDDESLSSTTHSKIMRLRAEAQPLAEVHSVLRELSDHLYTGDSGTLKALLKQAIPEYTPGGTSRTPGDRPGADGTVEPGAQRFPVGDGMGAV